MMKIALIGNGTVSKGVQQILSRKDIKFIYVRNQAKCLDERYTCNYSDILESDADVVVELINNDEAYPFIIKAMEAGKSVVTANKLTLSLHLKEYTELAEKKGVSLFYSASAGGGIPVIHNLYRSARIDRIEKISGIMNGTTNYILYHMSKDKTGFDEALKQARDLGYAEADPTSDIEGYDAQRKLMILSSLATESIVELDKIECSGISKITSEDIAYFGSMNKTVRLIAEAVFDERRYCAYVEPSVVDDDSSEAITVDGNNCISIFGKTIGRLTLSGQGAGCMPTANAVVSDILDIYAGAVFRPSFNSESVYDDELVLNSYIIRTDADAEVLKDCGLFKSHDGSYHYSVPLTLKKKNEIIAVLRKKDPELLCVRIG